MAGVEYWSRLKCVLLRKKLISRSVELQVKWGSAGKGGLIQYWICSSRFIVFLAATFIPICYNYWYPFVGCTFNYTHDLSPLLSLLVTHGTFCISLKPASLYRQVYYQSQSHRFNTYSSATLSPKLLYILYIKAPSLSHSVASIPSWALIYFYLSISPPTHHPHPVKHILLHSTIP